MCFTKVKDLLFRPKQKTEKGTWNKKKSLKAHVTNEKRKPENS